MIVAGQRLPIVIATKPVDFRRGHDGLAATVQNELGGRKRHIVTDTVGLLLNLVVHSAGIQDRDGAPDVLKAIAARYPSLRHVFADGGYAGPKLRDALKALGRWTHTVPLISGEKYAIRKRFRTGVA